jgi:uncharacterized protein YjiK
MAICLLGACQPDASPQYDLTSYLLVDVKWASGLAYGWGSLWTVADRGSNKLYRLTTEGKLQQEFRLKLAADSHLLVEKGLKLKNKSLDLEGIAADERRSLLYILSESNRMVLKVSLQGELVGLFPVQGHDTNRNQGLEGIAYSVSDDCLYLAEETPWLGPKKIYCYTLGGEQIGVYQMNVNYRLTGLCFKNGSLLMINSADLVPSRHQILKLNPPFESSSPQLFMDLDQDFALNQNYEGIASDEQGNIYLINDAQDNAESQLIKFSPSESQ